MTKQPTEYDYCAFVLFIGAAFFFLLWHFFSFLIGASAFFLMFAVIVGIYIFSVEDEDKDE